VPPTLTLTPTLTVTSPEPTLTPTPAPTQTLDPSPNPNPSALQVEPCPRPKEKPPPETEVLPYYPGAYVENATTVTLKLELARSLRYLEEIEPERSGGAKSTDELQRLVVLIRYDDTPTLLALMRIITDVNHAADMLSASNWESYKDAWREELDVISGVQLVDGEVRLLLLEGQPTPTPTPNPNPNPNPDPNPDPNPGPNPNPNPNSNPNPNPNPNPNQVRLFLLEGQPAITDADGTARNG
jgi:hypothetical protein